MNWILFSVEIYYFLAVVLFLFLSMLKTVDTGRAYVLALFLAASGVIVNVATVKLEGLLFLGTYRVDLFSQVFKAMLSLGLFLVVCICGNLEGVEKRRHPEFYLLLFTCTLAMIMLVSAVHLMTIYVALELSSYSLYILVALRRERNIAVEAGIKYFLVGITASAVMLFGMAILYGTIQATYIRDIIEVLPGAIDRPLVVIGLLLTLCGFFFKLAVFPFHFWAPDVYQGAANQVAAYIATASKVAAIAILVRMVALSSGDSPYLIQVLVTLSIVSMTVGNLAAIVQKDLKRLLAYSSVAHAGYVLIGILSVGPDGYASAIFYALAVLIMKFTSFLVLVKVSDNGRNIEVAHLAGLHRRSPLLAMALMLALFGLAGIPPTIGFTGKLLVFTAAMQQGYFTLVLIAMINVVISLYYYLTVVKAAYLLEPAEESPQLTVSPYINVLAAVLVTVMTAVGIYPSYLIELSRAAAGVLM
ncbi:MAG: NADH-quinone oxidoreductase subunit N [Desulfobacterales bacterium]|jgi:NADH-quinone oxidoreductase subunit N